MNVLGSNECARAGGGSRMLLTLWDFAAAQRELSGECLQTHGCNVCRHTVVMSETPQGLCPSASK